MALIAYRNLLWNAILTPDGTWEPEAPQSNLQTPQLGEIAMQDSHVALVVLDYTLEEASTIEIVGLLAYGEGVTGLTYRLYDSLNNLLSTQAIVPLEYPADGYFPRNGWIVLASPVLNVARVELRVEMADHAIFQAGGVWAGPVWTLGGLNPQFSLDVIDPSVVVTTDANQTRATRLRRYRQLSLAIADLNNRTGLGIASANDKVPNDNSLLDMMMFSGNSSPIVALPVTDTMKDIHTLGIYGYLQGRLSLQGNTTSGDETKKRHSTQLVVRESL